MFDVAVVGKGLFGAAAGRHLARTGLATVVVGPNEPSPVAADFVGPYGAHFDEARIIVTRGDLAGIALTHLAIDGTLALEADSATLLLTQSGALEITAAGAGPVQLVDGVVAVARGATRIDEPPPQGHCNPRRYIRAALDDLGARGGEIVPNVVTMLESAATGFTLTTETGSKIAAANVVVAAGAWSNRVLERKLALRLKQEYVLFAELDPSVAKSIDMRPTVIHGLTGRVEDIYTLPPLLYPDGRWYLKLGANTLHDRRVGQDSIDDWYHHGDGDAALADLTAAFRSVFPSIVVSRFHTERCVITYTPHGRPYIDTLGPEGLFVATGGNGHGASWADGVGALAARLVTNSDWGPHRRDDFRATFSDEEPKWPEPLLLADRQP